MYSVANVQIVNPPHGTGETESKAATPEAAAELSIAKPSTFKLDKFKSKRAAAIAGVQTMPTALPHYRMADAKDFVRLHPDEGKYWSAELCFANVPIKGAKRDVLHLIEEDLAMQYLPNARVRRFRLALATKPFDVFFLCEVPTRNLENAWNETNLDGCQKAKQFWTQVTSRKDEGVECYKIDFAENQDSFPDPNWPKQSLEEMIEITFAGKVIDRADHPALLRLRGANLKDE